MKKLFLAAVALMTVCAVSAQNDLIQQFNDGAAAMQAKDYAAAVTALDAFLDKAMDSDDESVLEIVAKAKKYVSSAYYNLGGATAKSGNMDAALEYAMKAADRAELYGETSTLGNAKNLIAAICLKKGISVFNNEDYAKAAEIFAKGYAANPRNTNIALSLAESYCRSGEYEKGMDVYRNVAAMPADKYADAVAKANEMMALYTNNEVAKLQGANDYDGIVAMAEKMLEADPTSALAYKVRLQAYYGMKNYDKVIELGEESAAAQVTDEGRSDVYFILGAAYNVKGNKDKAVAALKKVTAGSNVEAAKKSIAELN